MKHLLYSIIFVFALLITGCADAGKNQTVTSGNTVTLDANASTPSVGGVITRYRWMQVRGSHVTLSNNRSVQATFTAPTVTERTVLKFRLITIERGGHPRRFKSRDFVRIIVKPNTEEDTVAPTIVLNGESNITLEQGAEYVESGASATDNVDTNVSVEITGVVDTNTVGTYTITYTATDAAGNTTIVERTITVILTPDTEAPILSLNGAAEITLYQNRPYEEEGATAHDERDGNVTVIISGDINTSILGTYTVTYTATDTAGNTASVERTITVILPPDTEAPVLTLVGESNITLVLGAIYTDAGATVTDNRDNNITVVTQGFVDTNTSGIYTLTYSATDAAGNEALEIYRTVTVLESNDNNDSNSTKITISGKVVDINGTGIENALVTIGNHTFTTDSNGTYSTGEIASSERISVNVTHPAYLKNSRIIVTTAHNASMDISLDRPKATLTFDSTDGATLTENSGASVALPANGYIDENGSTYTGSVTVNMAYYPITTQSGRDTFPGTFEGTDGNTTFPIQSYGFMNVELSDSNGNPLNLDGNATATLTFPRDNTLSSPSTIPLWYYDEARGYWVQDGQATRSSNYASYQGTVTHFTSWNLDAKGSRATLEGCVEDENGTRISDASVQFRSINWNSYSVPTDANGDISVYNILAETDLTFSASKKIGNTFYYGEYPSSISLTEGETRVLSQCVVLEEQYSLPGTVTVTGTVMEYDYTTDTTTPMANQTIVIYTSGYVEVATGTSNANGTFSITFQTVDSLSYHIRTSNDDNYSTGHGFFILQENKTVYDLGTIVSIIEE